MGGDDGYRSNLIKLSNELKMENKITFTGFLKGKEKTSIIKELQYVYKHQDMNKEQELLLNPY